MIGFFISRELFHPAVTVPEVEAWIARFKVLAGASATIDVSQAFSLSEFDLSRATAATVFAAVAEPHAEGALDCNVSAWPRSASSLRFFLAIFHRKCNFCMQMFLRGLSLLSSRCPVAEKLKGGLVQNNLASM